MPFDLVVDGKLWYMPMSQLVGGNLKEAFACLANVLPVLMRTFYVHLDSFWFFTKELNFEKSPYLIKNDWFIASAADFVQKPLCL